MSTVCNQSTSYLSALPRVSVEPSREVGITKSLSRLYPVALKSSKYSRQQQRVCIKLDTDESQQHDLSERLAKSLQGSIWTKPQLRRHLLQQLPVVCRDRGLDLVESGAQALMNAGPFTVHCVRQALIGSQFFLRLGSLIDQCVKHEFEYRQGPIVQTLYATYGWKPLASGVLVSSRRARGHVCNHCRNVCDVQGVSAHGTELDAVATDSNGGLVLLEIKTHSGSTVTKTLLNRYKTQTWLGELMFRNTYGLCSWTKLHSYIVFVDPSRYTVDSVIQVPSVPKRIHPRLFSAFPSLQTLCFVKNNILAKKKRAPQISKTKTTDPLKISKKRQISKSKTTTTATAQDEDKTLE
ncbi:hypothetical protein [Cyprinid herpesvirus 2]|uniref:Protein Allo60 n=1 Tax=Cyprinid herpesvirus 2 TaxID=317878 RepID=A0A0E3T4R0_CYHV2|nr:hypothetical protein [Cyprinid herpesvirus 2]